MLCSWGGADRKALLLSAKKGEARGFSEINLNLGCPSSKVQAGRFGACLMKEADLVADCIRTLKQEISVPITAKTRIGIDDDDSYEFFSDFVHKIVAAGCDKLIVHARKAWLNGLSPKQNRSIPPLHYDYAYQIKTAFPNLPVVINGNIATLEDVSQHYSLVDGVMIGRLVCQNPYAITAIHRYFFPEVKIKARAEILEAYLTYLYDAFRKGASLSHLLKPIFNFFHGVPHCGHWKQQLNRTMKEKNVAYLKDALRSVDIFHLEIF